MVTDELVERMCKLMIAEHEQRNGRAWDHEWDGNLRADMTAVLRVAADALLGPISEIELYAYSSSQCPVLINRYGFDNIMRDRRARLEAPAKTTEEKVIELITAMQEAVTAALKEGKQ